MESIGKYRILEELGRGGMGVVYKAFDPLMEREVAIKVVSEEMVMIPEMKERFLREARTAGRLAHENITIVHDVAEEGGRLYIVMEYLGGEDLGKLIAREAPLPLQEKLDYAIQICRGLSFMHNQGFIHRDVKPANIRVVHGRVKIMDFGIARPASSQLTRTGATIGTPFYMSPEQIRGQKLDHRSDMFAFGVLLYELLTGEKPFTGEEPTSVLYKIVHEDPQWPAASVINRQSPLGTVLMRLLAKNPEDRYRTLEEVANILERNLSDIKLGRQAIETLDLQSTRGRHYADVVMADPRRTAPAPRPTAPREPLRAPPRRRSKTIVLVSAGVLAALLIVGILLHNLLETPTPVHGAVAINVLPWAEIGSIVDGDGHDVLLKKRTFTPCYLELPEGSYEIRLLNSDLADSMHISVQVKQGETQEIKRKFDQADYQDLLLKIEQPDSTGK